MWKLNPGNVILIKSQSPKTKMLEEGVYQNTEEWINPDKIIVGPFSQVTLYEGKAMTGVADPNDLNTVTVVNNGNKDKILQNLNYVIKMDVRKLNTQPIHPINPINPIYPIKPECECKQESLYPIRP